MVNRSEMSFGLIRVVIESDKTDTEAVTNLAYNTIRLLLPDAKSLAKLERRAKREEQKALTKNMLALKGKSSCFDCEDDSECGEDEENCPHTKKASEEIKNLYV